MALAWAAKESASNSSLLGSKGGLESKLNELILLLHLDADISEDLATFPRYSMGLAKMHLQHWVALTVDVGEHTSPIEHLGLEIYAIESLPLPYCSYTSAEGLTGLNTQNYVY